MQEFLSTRPFLSTGRGGGGGPEAPGRDNEAFEKGMEELSPGGALENGPGSPEGDAAGQETVTKF